MIATPARTIACGHCHGRHDSVAEVRVCSRISAQQQHDMALPGAMAAPAAPAPRSLGSVGGRLNEAALRSELRILEADTPAGRYAVRGDDEKVRFYLVQKPADGRWSGYTFIRQVTGHVGAEGTPVKHPRARVEVLGAIHAAGLAESSKLYGREIGSCGVCGRTLTDEESRAAGIGPVCASRTGW